MSISWRRGFSEAKGVQPLVGIAGEVVQKLVNYRRRIAVVGNFSGIDSKSLRDFIYESNKSGNMFFVASLEEARAKILSQVTKPS